MPMPKSNILAVGGVGGGQRVPSVIGGIHYAHTALLLNPALLSPAQVVLPSGSRGFQTSVSVSLEGR